MHAKSPAHLSRRHVITCIAAAAALLGPTAALTRAALAAKDATKAGRAPRFFSAAELELLDELAETIIPADAQSGGARLAGVARILDERIAESRDPTWRQSWHDDLAEIDRLSRGAYGKRFVKATPQQRNELMQRISRNEANPQEAGEYAFGTIKWAVADVYYRTEIGIHKDLGYQGNVMLDEFAGTDVSRRG